MLATKYLPLDGSEGMTGHLIPESSNLYYVGTSSKVWEGAYLRKLYATTWNALATPASIIASPTAAGILNFLGGVAGSVVARVYGARFDIPLAGDITFLASKMASLQLVEVQGSRGAAGFIDGAGGKRATFNEGICISII